MCIVHCWYFLCWVVSINHTNEYYKTLFQLMFLMNILSFNQIKYIFQKKKLSDHHEHVTNVHWLRITIILLMFNCKMYIILKIVTIWLFSLYPYQQWFIKYFFWTVQLDAAKYTTMTLHWRNCIYWDLIQLNAWSIKWRFWTSSTA